MDATRDIRINELRNTFNTNNLLSKTKGDKVIWALVVLLTLVSLLAVYSATGSLAYKNYKGNTEIYLFKQIAFIMVGIMVIYFAHLVNYTFYSRVAQIAFLVSLPLLFYTLFFGIKMNEGSRWIRLPFINMTMQTSDFIYVPRKID
jgi:cell division protein FtsW